MNLKDFTKEDITPADLKRLGASEPKIYMHKDGKTVMVPKDQEQEYTKQGFQKSPLKAEGGMPSSVIKHKERLAHMTDQELADRHGDTGEERLRQMAWRHGYGKMSSHYVDRIRRAKEKVESLQEDYAKMTKALITKLVKQGKTDEEIQNATGESGLRIRLIRKSIGFDTKEKQIKVAEENARRNFMNKKDESVQEGHSNQRHQAQTMLKLEELRDMIMVLDMEDDSKTSALTSLDQVADDISTEV